MESGQQIYRGDSGDSNDSSVGDIPIELPHLEAQYIYIKTISSHCLVCFVTEVIPITVSRRAPDKETRPSPYHHCS